MSKSAAIIIGASGGLGSAPCKQWQKSTETDYVIAISRLVFPCDKSSDDKTIQFIQCDYSETSIIKTCEEIKTLMGNLNLNSITRVCICNGILHNEGYCQLK